MNDVDDEIKTDIALFLREVLADRALRKRLVDMPEFVDMCRHVAPNMDVLLTMLGEQIKERSLRFKGKKVAPCRTATM